MTTQQERDGLRLLSLDGGGIRGLSELLILRQIMERIQWQENLPETPDPWEYFDLMGGTSTGGIIALMLGRLHMSVSEAIECYATLAKTVFSKPKKVKLLGDDKFEARELEKVIKNIVKKKTGKEDERMINQASAGEGCKTFVCAMGALNMSAKTPRLFRTYQSPKNRTYNCKIWEAARATSAAPTFFKQIVIGDLGTSEPYVDGGIGCNNPIGQVLEEAEMIFPNRQITCIVSIGTGQARTINIPKPSLRQRILPVGILKAIQAIATDCERSAQEMAYRFKDRPNTYFRFNVAHGLQEIGLEEWERLDEVTAHTENYIREVDEKLGAVVAAMLESRTTVANETGDVVRVMPDSTPERHYLKQCPSPTPVFTGRQNILSEMGRYFSGDVGQRVFVLYGVGGSGKSQIAYKFVEMCQAEGRFWDIFFIDASTAETINADLVDIGHAKGMGESGEKVLDWLAKQHKEWLIVLNNADDTKISLRDYFPHCSHGNILITSRKPETIDHASGPQSHCHISGMDPNDATSLLFKILETREMDNKETEALVMTIVGELGCFALAVVQAGAYITKTQCGLRRYLEILREHRIKFTQDCHGNIRKSDDYEWAMFTTWKISFDGLSKEAATFLQLCAFLHHDGIPEAIFRNAAANMASYAPVIPLDDGEMAFMNMAKGVLEMFQRSDSESPWDDQMSLEILSEIKSYSLIDFDVANRTYVINPLVHAWIRSTVDDSQMTRGCVRFILGVSITRHYETEDYAYRRTLVPHIDAVLQGGDATGLGVTSEFALVYYEAGRWKEAEELHIQVYETSLRMLGAEHPDTLGSKEDLAGTYWRRGKWIEAEELDIQVKEARLRTLGADHPDTLRSMASLSATYIGQGRWKEAEELLVPLQETSLRVFGAEHPDTLRNMANLAATYNSQERLKEAADLGVRVMETRLRVLGTEHIATLTSMANLAWTYYKQGRFTEAEDLGVQVKETRLKVLGAEHPDTLQIVTELAVYRDEKRRFMLRKGKAPI